MSYLEKPNNIWYTTDLFPNMPKSKPIKTTIKIDQMQTINDVLFFDVETTGLPEKGQTYEKDFMNFPHIVQIAWSINGVDKDYIIKPEGWEIPEDAAKIHGITTEIALAQGVPLKVALQDFLHHAYHSLLICAHNIYFDTSIIKANVLRTMGEEFFTWK